MFLCDLVVFKPFCQIGVGAYQHVAVNGGRRVGGEAALLVGGWVDGDGHVLSGLFIQNIILAFKAPDRILRISQHGGNLGGVHAGAVDDPLGFHIPFRGVQHPPVLQAGDTFHLMSEPETDAVCTGVLRQSDGVLHGVQNAGGGNIHGEISSRVRVDLVHALPVNHLHAPDAVDFPDFFEFENVFPILLVKADYQLSRALKGYVQLLRYLVKFLVALHGAGCFQ